MDGLTTSEAAKRLGIPQSTIKTWLNNLPIPSALDSRGRRRFDDGSLEILAAIKELRGKDKGYETIRRHIRPEPDRGSAGTNPSSPMGELETSWGSPDDIRAIVVEAMKSENGLAEKYARATYSIGQLEERVATLNSQLEEAREKIKLLEAPKAEPEVKRPWWKIF